MASSTWQRPFGESKRRCSRGKVRFETPNGVVHAGSSVWRIQKRLFTWEQLIEESKIACKAPLSLAGGLRFETVVAPAMNGNRSYLGGILVICILFLFTHPTKAVPEAAFGPPIRLSFTNSALEFEAGDFDNDGKDDLLVHTSYLYRPPAELILLSGFEGNAFSRVLKIPSTNYFHALSTGDFNNDGNLDVLLLEGMGIGIGGQVLEIICHY